MRENEGRQIKRRKKNRRMNIAKEEAIDFSPLQQKINVRYWEIY